MYVTPRMAESRPSLFTCYQITFGLLLRHMSLHWLQQLSHSHSRYFV